MLKVNDNKFSLIGEVPSVPSAEAKDAASAEIVTLNYEQLKLTVEKLEIDLEVVRQNINLKHQFSHHVRNYLWVFSGFCLVVLTFDGFNIGGFRLDKEVLCTLVGSAAVSVLGLVSIVLGGLFNNPTKR